MLVWAPFSCAIVRHRALCLEGTDDGCTPIGPRCTKVEAIDTLFISPPPSPPPPYFSIAGGAGSHNRVLTSREEEYLSKFFNRRENRPLRQGAQDGIVRKEERTGLGGDEMNTPFGSSFFLLNLRICVVLRPKPPLLASASLPSA